MSQLTNNPLFQGNPLVAVTMADAFFKNASTFLDSVPNDDDPNLAAKFGAEHFGELLASAVELHFAAELYIKALLINAKIKYRNIHHLAKLFDLFHEHIRDAIETKFDQESSEKRSLKEILTICDKGFETWRYIYEKGAPGKQEVFSFPSDALRDFNRILHYHAYATHGLHQRPKWRP
jgi:hypothetical protein